MGSYTVLSLCKITDGKTNGWGLGWSDSWGISDCKMIGDKEQASTYVTNVMKDYPNWIQVDGLDGSATYFNPKSSGYVPTCEVLYVNSVLKDPCRRLCIVPDGSHTYCIKVADKEFLTKAPLFGYKYSRPECD